MPRRAPILIPVLAALVLLVLAAAPARARPTAQLDPTILVSAQARPASLCLAGGQARPVTHTFVEEAGGAGRILTRTARYAALSGDWLTDALPPGPRLVNITPFGTTTLTENAELPQTVADLAASQQMRDIDLVITFDGQTPAGEVFSTTDRLRLTITADGRCTARLPLVAAPPMPPWQPKTPPLITRWAADVSPTNARPEYPRPQFTRDEWLNLNGEWQFASGPRYIDPPFGQNLPETILVPFPVESALSGIMRSETTMWYRRLFTVPREWARQRVQLNFDAVDWEARVWVNGQLVGTHRGGYDTFSFDITDWLRPDSNELIVFVYDPTDSANVPMGKQRLNPRVIWYTASSGIWQTVWLEPVPSTPITRLALTPDVAGQRLQVTAFVDGPPDLTVEATAAIAGEPVGFATGPINAPFDLSLPNPHVWTPDDPFLYDLRVVLKRGDVIVDTVGSYFGMRTIGLQRSETAMRPLLNGRIVLQQGVMDQGYWPDGLYTAPTDEALRFDVEQAKALGFNVVRKHMKVEPARWYYWADKLGLMVWQDMPALRDDIFPNAEEQAQFQIELREMILEHYNSPSIIVWVLFNEKWGQYEAKALTQMMRGWDATRLIDSASGWYYEYVGDIRDYHCYPSPCHMVYEALRMIAQGEYGGVGLVVPGHHWSWRGYAAEWQDTGPQLAGRYRQLINEVIDRISSGASAAIYTQLYDVENELNGLWTYDRAVLKVDPQVIRTANERVTGINYNPPEAAP